MNTRSKSRRPWVVDLFAGAGGLGLGFEQAGFDVVAAVELDPVHACVHAFNFPGCATICRSISDLSGDDIRAMGGLGAEEIDVVIGGPPCQGFSLIGRRVLDDPRNSLVMEFVRMVSELSPRLFLFENVKGLTVGKHKQVLRELVAEFESIGYGVRLPWRVLNAANYGVPQDRERLFILGARGDTEVPDYPSAIFEPPGGGTLALLPAGPTCRDAIGDLPDAELFPELEDDDSVFVAEWPAGSDYAGEMRCLSKKDWHYGHPRVWERDLLTSSARTKHTDISRRRFANAEPGAVEPVSRFFKLRADGVSNTLRAGTDSARGAFTSPRPIHYDKNRCVTVREMARLHGFPDWFRFHKTKWHGARQVGNAVPPPLARILASKCMNALGVEPAVSDFETALGDPALLAMNMTRAAAYWEIENPIAGRDRKSGDRKRRQTEVEADREARADTR